MTVRTIAAVAEVDTAPVRDLLELTIGPGRRDRLLTEVDYYLTGPANLVGAYDDVLVGILGFLVDEEQIVLRHIATQPSLRRRHIGKSMIEWLATRYPDRLIVAETDAGSVGFYRRLDFTVFSLGEKYPGVERFAVTRTQGSQGNERLGENASPSRRSDVCPGRARKAESSQ